MDALGLKRITSTLLVVLAFGCQKSESPATRVVASASGTQGSSSGIEKSAFTGGTPSVSGPQVSFIGLPFTLQMTAPAGMVLASASWNFGDGSPVVSSLAPVTHTLSLLGYRAITINVTDSAGQTATLIYHMNVVQSFDNVDCMTQIAQSVPASAFINASVGMSLQIPVCFAPYITSIKWDFGDATTVATGVSTSHVYSAPNDNVVQARVYSTLNGGVQPLLILSSNISITAPLTTPTPTPTPNPLACAVDGATRTSYSATTTTQTVSCGLGGSKDQLFRTKTTETCSVANGVLLWTVSATSLELYQDGTCNHQSCQLADGTVLPDQSSRTMYSSASPTGACSTVAETRTCQNGVLGGSATSSLLICHGGCGDFGPNGTVKSGIVTGETQVALTCSFGETGFFDTFNQLSDQTCSDGQVVASNTRQGTIKTAGACPVYSWTPTESWSSCSADCGGSQSRNFECHNDQGAVSPTERCSGAAPIETQVCDGNPAAVARVDSVTSQQEGGSTQMCPANQIGVSIQVRDMTTLTAYACLNHAVQQASQTFSYGNWSTENYCRTYTAYRCSQDSLSNTDAEGRYQWMLKCSDQVPAIKEFLTNFADVKVSGGYTISSDTRHVYPTFMDHALNPEKPWIAPKVATAGCQVPSTAYVAAVCLSSCATPESEIIAEAKANMKMKKTPFIEALTQNYGFVATMSPNARLDSKELQKTKVQQWVTEMIETDHPMLEFRMRSGGSLKLTPNHPVLSEDGTMKLAGDFKAGEHLTRLGGAQDEILSINSYTYYGKVYNLFVESSVPQKNIVVTNGYLNGTAFFQNEGADQMNRELFRQKLMRGVFNQ